MTFHPLLTQNGGLKAAKGDYMNKYVKLCTTFTLIWFVQIQHLVLAQSKDLNEQANKIIQIGDSFVYNLVMGMLGIFVLVGVYKFLVGQERPSAWFYSLGTALIMMILYKFGIPIISTTFSR